MPPELYYSRPTHAWGSKPGLGRGTDGSGSSTAGDPGGLRGPRPGRASPRVHSPAPGGPWGLRLAPAPAHTRRAAAAGRLRRRGGCAPSASREHKQGEEAGVSAWAQCQRAGAGTQCPERAGGRRAGSENSLTQQPGKWVCSLTRSTALAACGQRGPDSARLLGRERRAHRQLLGAPTPTPLQPCRDLHVAGLRIPLPSRSSIKASHNPQPEQSQLCAPGRGILLTLRAGVARQQLLCTRPFPPTPTSLVSLWRSWWGYNCYLQVEVDICSRVLGRRGRRCWKKWVIGQKARLCVLR